MFTGFLPGVYLLIFNEMGFQVEDCHHFHYICRVSSLCILTVADNQWGWTFGKRVPIFIALTVSPLYLSSLRENKNCVIFKAFCTFIVKEIL